MKKNRLEKIEQELTKYFYNVCIKQEKHYNSKNDTKNEAGDRNDYMYTQTDKKNMNPSKP